MAEKVSQVQENDSLNLQLNHDEGLESILLSICEPLLIFQNPSRKGVFASATKTAKKFGLISIQLFANVSQMTQF